MNDFNSECPDCTALVDRIAALEAEDVRREAWYQAAVKRIAMLEADNKALREQVAKMRSALNHVRFYGLDNVPAELRAVANNALVHHIVENYRPTKIQPGC